MKKKQRIKKTDEYQTKKATKERIDKMNEGKQKNAKLQRQRGKKSRYHSEKASDILSLPLIERKQPRRQK